MGTFIKLGLGIIAFNILYFSLSSPLEEPLLPSSSLPLESLPAESDFWIGDQRAPLKIIEYSSLSCFHCSTFHQRILPKLKKDYLDKGKVCFIFRDFPLDKTALQGAQLARCDPQKYHLLIQLIFKHQEEWISKEDPMEDIMNLAKKVGLTQTQIQTCLDDPKLLDQVLETRLQGEKLYQITGTPHFIIKGTAYPYALSYKKIKKIIDRELASLNKEALKKDLE